MPRTAVNAKPVIDLTRVPVLAAALELGDRMTPKAITRRMIERERGYAIGLLELDEALEAEVKAEVKERLGAVAYHVRTLVDRGILELVGTGQVRGALEHYYRLDLGQVVALRLELAGAHQAITAGLEARSRRDA